MMHDNGHCLYVDKSINHSTTSTLWAQQQQRQSEQRWQYDGQQAVSRRRVRTCNRHNQRIVNTTINHIHVAYSRALCGQKLWIQSSISTLWIALYLHRAREYACAQCFWKFYGLRLWLKSAFWFHWYFQSATFEEVCFLVEEVCTWW